MGCDFLNKPEFNKEDSIIDEINDFDRMAQLLKTKGEAHSLTKGASWRPLFREHRDIVVIKRLERDIKVNDVLLYRKRGHSALVLHRLIRIKKDGSLVFRGDNNYFTEYDIARSDIVGILSEFYREGKYGSCQDKRYLRYSFYIRHSYALRYFWKILFRPTIGKIKRKILRQNPVSN